MQNTSQVRKTGDLKNSFILLGACYLKEKTGSKEVFVATGSHISI